MSSVLGFRHAFDNAMNITGPLLAFMAKLLSGAQARWIDCQPDTCQRIYFANHTSHLDPLVIWGSLPRDVRQVTRPVAAKDYWSRGPIKPFLARSFNALLIDRKKIKVHQSPIDLMIREIGDTGTDAKHPAQLPTALEIYRHSPAPTIHHMG